MNLLETLLLIIILVGVVSYFFFPKTFESGKDFILEKIGISPVKGSECLYDNDCINNYNDSYICNDKNYCVMPSGDLL